MSRTLNGEILIDDEGNLNETVWINNLLACAELLREANENKEEAENVEK